MKIREYERLLKEQKEPKKASIPINQLKKDKMINSINSLKRNGLSRKEIAEKLDCCMSTVTRYFRMIKEQNNELL